MTVIIDAAAFQREQYTDSKEAGWDAEDKNTFAEEIAHIHAELSEAFEEWRKRKDVEIYYRESDGKPEGVPIEFADVLMGLFYNAERMGFDLFKALEIKRQFNRTRNYHEEGRQLHGI